MTATAILAPVKSKTCQKCGEIKVLSEFVKKEASKDGLNSICSKCRKDYRKSYFELNKDDLRKKARDYQSENKDERSEYFQVWYSENRETIVAKAKANYLKTDKANRRITAKAWEFRNKDRLLDAKREYSRAKYASNPRYRLSLNISTLIRVSLIEKGFSKIGRTHEILGCDWEFFKTHIEKQFTKGMSWDNRSEWQIDHITPLATAKTEAEVIALNHFTNLRPLWAAENLAKSDSIQYLI